MVTMVTRKYAISLMFHVKLAEIWYIHLTELYLSPY